jgi:prevent-host-death family protein
VITRIPLTKAGINLGAIIKRVYNGKESFILEKDGLPVAALMDVGEFEDYLELHDPEINQVIAESQGLPCRQEPPGRGTAAAARGGRGARARG